MGRGAKMLDLVSHRPLEAVEAELMRAGSFVAAAHAIASWTMHAAPGRICVYARVERLSRGGVGERVRQLHAAGLLRMLPQRRAENGLFEYRAQRTALPFSQGRPVPDEAGLSAEARLLLDLLVQVADEGAVCPTDHDLAALLGMKSPSQVGRLMAQLRLRRLIATEMVPGPAKMPVRVVTIAETGAVTAPPAKGRKQ